MYFGFKLSGFNDTGEYWRSWYETDTFEQDVKRLYDELRPLYQQLQAYVRRKLKQRYGEDKFPKSGHIPAHILGERAKRYLSTKCEIHMIGIMHNYTFPSFPQRSYQRLHHSKGETYRHELAIADTRSCSRNHYLQLKREPTCIPEYIYLLILVVFGLHLANILCKQCVCKM